MRFEKMSNDKIKITLSNEDLIKKDIDFHSFMSNPVSSQDLFIDMLKEAEKEIGFVTKDYSLKIEAFAIPNDKFIILVTRSLPSIESIPNTFKKKIHIKRRKQNFNSEQAIYSFNSLDDFCYYIDFLKTNNINIKNIAKSIILYNYKDKYYLVFDNINSNFENLKPFFSSITEFGSYLTNSDLFVRKLVESGNIVVKNTTFKNFIK